MKYITISAWSVLDHIENGKTIYVLDREVMEVFAVNGSTVGFALELIKNAKKYSDRYDFWYEEKEPETEETEDEVNE